jgi:hypothetical protein
MTTAEATKVIRNYVRQNGRRALRENLETLGSKHPNILNAGKKFLEVPNAVK